jgi:Caspase domain
MDCTRRRLLQASLAVGTVLALPRWSRAQASSPLVGAPKVALVLGNGRYKDVPLRNPVNDAKAVGAALGALGFAVTLKTDAPRTEMAAAVQAYVAELMKRRSVGVFYYAGHGVQLAWRNYMVPVDAAIDTIADIQTQGVEVGKSRRWELVTAREA